MLPITVYNELNIKLGSAASYSEARKLHIQDFQSRGKKVLEEAYAGVSTSECSAGRPLFYMTENFIERGGD